MTKNRYFYMNDIAATIIVEHTARKDFLSWLNGYCEMVISGYGYAGDDK